MERKVRRKKEGNRREKRYKSVKREWRQNREPRENKRGPKRVRHKSCQRITLYGSFQENSKKEF